MITLQVGDCKVDILPIVNGLISEADRVREEFSDHEAYGVALSIEGIQCLKNRRNIEEMFDVSELDMVYAKHLERFGEVEIPSPAMYTFIDLVTESGKLCIPLDMNDSDFTELYCDNVGAMEFIKEHNVAKKGMKRIFDGSTPEKMAKQWDDFVNSNLKSYGKLSKLREEHIANEIKDIAKYKRELLAIMEVERVDGVVSLLGGV
ncbi:MAG: hypothetical protein J5813_02420 [Candidatus Methanomethylophilaceae archaeon]|nr:hypothetical protein [Candidatus Methanomethylophilaceae archaeon]